MEPLAQARREDLAQIRFVLTDMDETLTFRGRLAAETYRALERLQSAGLVVIPVTAAPAGWCDQMARMWPVDAVIGENGGLVIQREGEGVRRAFWSADPEAERARLQELARDVGRGAPSAVLADDQPFRLTTLAFRADGGDAHRSAVLEALSGAGAQVTENNLWLLGWLGGFDKLAMARRVLGDHYGLDIDLAGDQVLYVGDSLNDAPMFSFFRRTAGVSTVRRYLADLPDAPAWITEGPGGAGFVEIADAVIAARGG